MRCVFGCLFLTVCLYVFPCLCAHSCVPTCHLHAESSVRAPQHFLVQGYVLKEPCCTQISTMHLPAPDTFWHVHTVGSCGTKIIWVTAAAECMISFQWLSISKDSVMTNSQCSKGQQVHELGMGKAGCGIGCRIDTCMSVVICKFWVWQYIPICQLHRFVSTSILHNW